MMEALPEHVQRLLTSIPKDHRVDDFIIESDQAVSSDGDGYIGVLKSIYIKDKNSDWNLHLAIKTAPTSEKLREKFPTRLLFLKEIHMYEKVLPELTTFQEEYNIAKPFNSYTKLYGAITDDFRECLILRNLKADGYKMVDRREPLSSDHLRLVMETYGKLHAVSLAMKILDRERFLKTTEKISKNIMIEFQKMASEPSQAKTKGFDLLFASAVESLKDNPRLLEAVDKAKKTMLKLSSEYHKNDNHEHAVITHADCWSANMLFKYEDRTHPTIPTKVTLIDWQLSYVTHPIHDLSYFFYISADKKDLHKYKEYLRFYHNALTANLTDFGLETKSVYSFECLQEEWKEFSMFGFMMVLVMLQQTLSDTKTHDFEELAEAEGSVLSLKWVEVTDKYKERMVDLVEFLADQDLLR